MFDMMNQARNAIEAYNVALKASSSNIANMNVTGYKRLDVSFQSIFEKVLSRGTAAQTDFGGTNPRQLGQGMSLSSVNIDFSSGEYATGSSVDLAISGQGLFIVSPDGGNTFRYTRAGNFGINGYKLTSNGMTVYGLDDSNNLVPISSLPSGNKEDYTWDADGTLKWKGSNAGFKIALTYFPNPSGLTQAQGTTFAKTPASGEAAAAQAPGGAVGTILTGQLEQSNVFYIGETIDAIEIQRAMTGNLTVIRMASDMISQFINKLS